MDKNMATKWKLALYRELIVQIILNDLHYHIEGDLRYLALCICMESRAIIHPVVSLFWPL